MWFLFWATGCLRRCCLFSQICDLSSSSVAVDPNFISLWLKKMLCIYLFRDFETWFMGLTCGLSCDVSHVRLGRMHMLLLLGRVFCIYVWFIWLIMLFRSDVSLLIFCLIGMSITGTRVLKFWTIIVELTFYFQCIHLCSCIFMAFYPVCKCF